MSGQHTPGPWFVSTATGNTHLYVGSMVVTSPRNAFPNASTPSALAEIDGQTLRANAQLMAAAPELLVALKRIDSMCERPIRFSSIAVQEVARAAIAKAEGGAA